MPVTILPFRASRDARMSSLESIQCDPEEIAFLSLFFDKFILPFSYEPPALNRMGQRGKPLVFGPEIDFLNEKGLVLASQPGFDDDFGGFIRHIVQSAENKLDQDCVVPSQYVDVFDVKNIVLTANFLNDLVVPPPGAPIEDILDFKFNRSAELLSFWDAIYSVANDVSVIRSRNLNAAVVSRLSLALRELQEVSEERWHNCFFRPFRLSFVVGSAFAGALLEEYMVSDTSNFVGALAGLLVANGSLEFSLGLSRSKEPISQTARAMSYVLGARAHFNA
jgi:hypothetical protein